MAQGDYGLDDAEMWSNPLRTESDVDRRLHRAGFTGLVIDGPTAVDLATRETLPLLVYHADTLRALAACSFPAEAVLVGIRLEDHLTLARPAVYRDELEPKLPDVDARPPPDGTGSQLHVLEARERLELPWSPATWQLCVLLRDRRSDEVRVRLHFGDDEPTSSSPADGGDSRSDTLLGVTLSHVATTVVPPPWPTPRVPFPFYGERPDSPEPPAEPGIVLSVPRVTLLEDDARCVLQGAFRLVPLRAERLPTKMGLGGTFMGTGASEPTAIMSVTLVLVAVDRPGVYVVGLRVPSYRPCNPFDPAPKLTGHFAIDLLELEGVPHVPQTYYVHAFAGQVYARATLALVARDDLPPV